MIYEVIVDISNSEVDRVFDYTAEFPVPVGSRVSVPFGRRTVEGYVLRAKEHSDYEQLKSILHILDEIPPITAEMLQILSYMKRRYHLRTIDVLRLFLPSEMRNGRVKERYKRLAKLVPSVADTLVLKANAVRQKELLTYLKEREFAYTEELGKRFGAAAVSGLVQKGAIEIETVRVQRTPYQAMPAQDKSVDLTEEQTHAVNEILGVKDGKTHLLFGVTGSGKTEVYLRVIRHVLDVGKTAILLVPEISLTPRMLQLFRMRFGSNVAILHSGLSAGERFDEWQRLRFGEAKIAIGARSAIFAPLENLGVIIIDEEHDSSYQSESNPRYDTHEVARERAKWNDCSLVLGSATPSLETFYEAQNGKIHLIELKNRVNRRPMPVVEIVDMAQELRSGRKGSFSGALLQSLTEVIQNGDQAILFLNRRGYSSFVMCQRCGYVAKCRDCDVSLTYHAEENVLQCHYCGKKYYMLRCCPDCKNESLRQGKIGTEKVVHELNRIFPGVKVLRMDNDTTTSKESHFNIINAFANHEAQILVGTQMVAKGHDFPDVTLVGILDADQSLYHADYLSNERTFQLLTQVEGRCGRDKKSGTVVLQTYSPSHFVLRLAALQDYRTFYQKEINMRQASGFPPFTTLVRLLYSDESEQNCVSVLNEQFSMLQELQKLNTVQFPVLKKMKAPVHKIEKKYRYQIVIRLERTASEDLLQRIYKISDRRSVKSVSVFTELNPQNMN